MLQQTRATTVIPYLERWLVRFPTIRALAAAPLEEVLVLWEGLGYYGRARSLHAASQQVMAEHGGELPRSAATLRKLPGIGRYTAGAIASLAFGLPEPALDGNGRRVLARVFDVDTPLSEPNTQERLWELAARIVAAAPERAGRLNEALMDLGALVCVPRRPACPVCPLAAVCVARERGLQEERPVRKRPQVTPHYDAVAAVISDGAGRYLLARRPPHGLLGGLWEFPGERRPEYEDPVLSPATAAGVVRAALEARGGSSRDIPPPGGDRAAHQRMAGLLAETLRSSLGVEIEVLDEILQVPHAYTHFRITLHAFSARILSGDPEPLGYMSVAWVAATELSTYPLPATDRRIAQAIAATSSPA